MKLTLGQCLSRGLKKKCPQCGNSDLFQAWTALYETCGSCGLKFREMESNTWFFMYMSTALITGFFILGMFFIRPEARLWGRTAFALGGLLTIGLSIHRRKGLAMGLEHWLDQSR